MLVFVATRLDPWLSRYLWTQGRGTTDAEAATQQLWVVMPSLKSNFVQGNVIWSGWWFQTVIIFHFIYGIILPIDFHIFQDG
jgi:hypothetical protein